MTEIYIVYAVMENMRTALHAFKERVAAESYVKLVTQERYGSDGYREASWCELLDIKTVYIETMRVK